MLHDWTEAEKAFTSSSKKMSEKKKKKDRCCKVVWVHNQSQKFPKIFENIFILMIFIQPEDFPN